MQHTFVRGLAMAIGLGIFLFSLAPGPARADNAIGMAALEAGDFKRAHALLLPEAEAGNAVAQYEIGRMYDRGRGVDFDAAAAAEWFRAAAEQDNARAQHALGTYFEEGKGVRQDMAQAAHWYGRAAALGNAKAARNLGNLYLEGNGVTRDLVRAAELFRRAADGGNSKAYKNLGYMYYFGTGVVQDLQHAADLFRLGAADDQAKSEFALGFLHYHGEVVDRDLASALALFQSAAAKGHADGQIFLGRMLAEGEGIEQDMAEAWFWFTLAEAQEPCTASYYFAKYAGKSKQRPHIMKIVREGIDWFAKELNVNKDTMRTLRDGGLEFAPPSQMKGMIVKLGAAIESKNAHAQKVLHRLLKAKRGGLQSCVKQMMDIVNNTEEPVLAITISDGQTVWELGDLKPNGMIKFDGRLKGEGGPEVSWTFRGERYSEGGCYYTDSYPGMPAEGAIRVEGKHLSFRCS